MGITAAVVSGYALAMVAPWIHRAARGSTGWLLALLPAALTLYFAMVHRAIGPEGAMSVAYPWVPSLGVSLSFHVDGLGLLFALLIGGIGALVVVYAGGYLAGTPQLGRFYTLVLTFMASMLGLVLAGNLITMFVFWELTSLTSYLLIGLDHDRPAARAAALQALLVTGGGGLALLAGSLLLGHVGGSLELASLLAQGDTVRDHALYVPILLLILLGAFTKSAQVPFHFWLPNAMEAPTPVSAYLHSATMVTAGVYLLARLSPVLGGTVEWHYLVAGAGITTMLLGAIRALASNDLKRILAYSTISTLGAMVLMLGLDTILSVEAAMLLLLVHALYKGALFLVAGAVAHETGTRDVRRLAGLARTMPITATAGALAALSMAGLPPMLGFITKELFYEAKLQAPRAAGLITLAGVTANMLLVAVAGLVGLKPFLARSGKTRGNAHEVPPALWLGPLTLAAVGLLSGLLPATVPSALVSAASSAVQARPSDLELAMWHGINPVLALSVVTLAGGVAIYAARDALARRPARSAPWLVAGLAKAGRWSPERGYDAALRGLNWLARAQTRVLQSGYLRYYLILIIMTTVGLVGYTLVGRGEIPSGATDVSGVRFYEALIALLIVAATGLAVRTSSRLTAVAALGVVGYGVALIYTLFGAPDLAMTQFAIETLTVFLFVLVLYRLPRFVRYSSRAARARDAALALSAGALMTALVLVTTAVPMESSLKPYFAANAVPLARGRNIDNVLLVDIRALDTLGEITVLAVAAIGVFALLHLRLDD